MGKKKDRTHQSFQREKIKREETVIRKEENAWGSFLQQKRNSI